MNIHRIVFSIVFLSCVLKNLLLFSFQTEHHSISDPNERARHIEFFMMKPDGNGPFPVIYFLHGYQYPGAALGGKQLIDLQYLDPFVKEGIVAVAISLPGFGGSSAIDDYCGPLSQQAIGAVMKHCETFAFVDARRVGIYGVSRGATIASMMHATYPNIMLQMLDSGTYDFTERVLPAYLSTIKETMLREMGESNEARRARSAIHHTHLVQAKTLLLHGELDDRRGLPSAELLHKRLMEAGKESELHVYPDVSHVLPREKFEVMIPFVRRHFFNRYGIGIKITKEMTPALQICKIIEGSPADLSGKLKKGDAILRIPPNNDEIEIDALRMPAQQLISHILGKKGTSLRLHVQHFTDLTYEDIVIERG